MKTGEQLWNHGTWMLNAIANREHTKRWYRKPESTDIFNFGISLKEGDFVAYNKNNGKIAFEAESYDEAQKVLEELYGT